MIDIKDRSQCCGCGACAQRCPKHCICMETDKEGFSYPQVDAERCVDCGACEKACPFIFSQEKDLQPISAYAAYALDDELRLNCSSGAIFPLLAMHVIEEKGVVFGARFDDELNVIHDYCDTKEGLLPFLKSKYVQSKIGTCYHLAELFLKEGRKVLFTGTPCQIVGLHRFLKKDYDNLIAVAIICHGVPSPLVWSKYISMSGLTSVNFRAKPEGWSNYHFEGTTVMGQFSEVFHKNLYMKIFLENLSLKPSCYQCKAKHDYSGCDLIIGDFWRINDVLPELNDEKGCSAIIALTPKGDDVVNKINIRKTPVTLPDIINGNPCLTQSVRKPINRDYFFHRIKKGDSVDKAWGKVKSVKLTDRIQRIIYRKFFS